MVKANREAGRGWTEVGRLAPARRGAVAIIGFLVVAGASASAQGGCPQGCAEIHRMIARAASNARPDGSPAGSGPSAPVDYEQVDMAWRLLKRTVELAGTLAKQDPGRYGPPEAYEPVRHAVEGFQCEPDKSWYGFSSFRYVYDRRCVQRHAEEALAAIGPILNAEPEQYPPGPAHELYARIAQAAMGMRSSAGSSWSRVQAAEKALNKTTAEAFAAAENDPGRYGEPLLYLLFYRTASDFRCPLWRNALLDTYVYKIDCVVSFAETVLATIPSVVKAENP